MKNDNQYTLQQGFTLIELMVALTIGLLVSAAALQLFTGGVITTRLQEANAELQDSGIFGLEYVARDVRLANFGNVSNPELHDQTPFGGIVLTGDATNGNLPFASVDASWLSHSKGDTGWSGVSNVDAGASDQLVIQFIAPNNMVNCEGKEVVAGEYVIQRYFMRKDTATGAAATDYVLACDANKKPAATGKPTALADITEFGGSSNTGEVIMPRVDYVRFYLGTRIGNTNSMAYYTINQYKTAVAAARTADTTANSAATPPVPRQNTIPRIVEVKMVVLVRPRSSTSSNQIDPTSQTFAFPDVAAVKPSDTSSKYIRRMYSTTMALRNAIGEKI